MNLYFSSWANTISLEAASDGEEALDIVACGEGHDCTLPEEGPLASMTSSWLSSVRRILFDFSRNFSAWIVSTMKSLQVSEEESGSSTHLVQGAPGKRSQASSYSSSSCNWHHVLCYAVWVGGPDNTLSVVVRDVCQAICDEYADEVKTKMNGDNLLMDSTGVEISPTVLLLLIASMW